MLPELWLISSLIVSDASCFLELEGGQQIPLDFCEVSPKPDASPPAIPSNNTESSAPKEEELNCGSLPLSKYVEVREGWLYPDPEDGPISLSEIEYILGCRAIQVSDSGNLKQFEWRGEDGENKVIIKGSFEGDRLRNLSRELINQ